MISWSASFYIIFEHLKVKKMQKIYWICTVKLLWVLLFGFLEFMHRREINKIFQHFPRRTQASSQRNALKSWSHDMRFQKHCWHSRTVRSPHSPLTGSCGVTIAGEPLLLCPGCDKIQWRSDSFTEAADPICENLLKQLLRKSIHDKPPVLLK